MANNGKQNGKGVKTNKSFLSAGPVLHYSHQNVFRFWCVALVSYTVTCLFWAKITSGHFASLDLTTWGSVEHWRLGQTAVNIVSIFEYPWQIMVLAILMGILAIAPILISQLMSFSYCVPFLLAAAFIGDLPLFTVSLFVSCFATACRPLRFRSRFISVALATAPQLIYWALLGGAKGLEPIKFGFSFTPWAGAWISALIIAGIVLGIGHFTRYKPGLVGAANIVFLAIAIITFEIRIGFDELDYQKYIAGNRPEEMEVFHDHSVTEILDAMINDESKRKKLEGHFYPTEPIPLRAKLKKEMQNELQYNQWPWWLDAPDELDYLAKRAELMRQYNMFIKMRFRSPRMPIALYSAGILSEFSPNAQKLGEKEILQFYSEYPFPRSKRIWNTLYAEFGQSPESIEARWRIAHHIAGEGKEDSFELAISILNEALSMAQKRIRKLEASEPPPESLFSPFQPAADSVMTTFKLRDLERRIKELKNLIGPHNRDGSEESAKRLSRFVRLNPNSLRFRDELADLLDETKKKDPLRDNILLAQTRLTADKQLRSEQLAELHEKYQDTDGGFQALYELGLLQMSLWREQDDSHPELKKEYLSKTRATLTQLLEIDTDSIYSNHVKSLLESLPVTD